MKIQSAQFALFCKKYGARLTSDNAALKGLKLSKYLQM